jgi:diguanylate cyclase (GGDEF)-like protein
VLLPGLPPADAFQMAEKIRLKVQQWSGDTAITTVSIGVASAVPDDTTDWTRLVTAADKALYAAKADGRNCTVLAGFSKLSLVA